MKEGRPVFVGNKDGVRLGISTRKPIVSFGEPVMVDIWVDNRSDEPFFILGCPPDLHFGDVFDQSGNRLIGIDELKYGRETIRVCASARMVVEIPPHICMGPVEAHQPPMTLDYELAPGIYYLFPRSGIDPALFKQGLRITVREP